MTLSNAERARLGYQAAVSGDLDQVREFLHPDVKWHAGDPNAVGACQDREQVLRFMRKAQTRRGVGELVDVVEAGDKVVVILRPASAEAASDETAAPALVANVTTFRDGKAIEMVHYPDPAAALAAAGVSR